MRTQHRSNSELSGLPSSIMNNHNKMNFDSRQSSDVASTQDGDDNSSQKAVIPPRYTERVSFFQGPIYHLL